MFNFFRKKSSSLKSEDKKPAEKTGKKSAKKEENISAVMEKTGWSREKTVMQIEDARKRIGIGYRDYNKYDFFKVPLGEQEEQYQKILEKKELRKKKKETHILSVMEKTGWSREETIAQIEDARKRLGIIYKDYDFFEFHRIPLEEQEKEYQYLAKRTVEKQEKKAGNKEKALRIVMDETGWDFETAVQKMDEALEACGAEYLEYAAYRFWELDGKTQKTFFTKGCNNIIRKKFNTNQENISLFKYKNKFNQIFSEYLGRVWSYNKGISLEEFAEKFKSERKVIYKPLSENGGFEVQVFDFEKNSIEAVYEQVKKLPMGVVEGYLIQHPEMSRFSKNAVNTLRIVSVFDGSSVDIIYAAFRMAGGEAVVDNLHMNGVLALVDLETGTIMTDAIDWDGKAYETHPDTGEKIKGFAVPYWKEIKELICKAGSMIEGVGYVGWDVAVTKQGPVLVEGNTAPGQQGVQLPCYLLNHKGVRSLIEKYL